MQNREQWGLLLGRKLMVMGMEPISGEQSLISLCN